MQMIGRALLLCVLAGLATACGDSDNAGNRNGNRDDATASLPKPEMTGGSVTGMPDRPGPGQVGPPSPDATSPDMPVASDDSLVAPALGGDGLPVQLPSPGEPAALPDAAPLSLGEPTPQDAVDVVRDYYGAINAHDYARAHALWSDGGPGSGKTPQQLADGFADTVGVSVQLDAPGRAGAAAGSRYIEVPVTIAATQRDGGVRRYVGVYTLRRAVADGATAEQRAWRIASAQVREASP